MLMDQILELKNNFDENGILLAFSGSISQPVLSGFAKGMEIKLGNLGVEAKTVRNIFEILIEMMQNVLNYSYDSRDTGQNMFESNGIVVVGFVQTNNKYFVMSGNKIVKGREVNLQSKIDYLNTLDAEALKNLYRERRRGRQDVHSRGAGLGLIDLARKSSEKLEYRFTDLDNETIFFSLKAII